MIVFYFLGSDPFQRILQSYASRDFTLFQRLLTETRVLGFYLYLFFVPLVGKFALFHDFQISTGLLTPLTTLLSIFCWMGTLMIAWWSRKKWPVLTWTILWFLCAHLVESTLIPLELVFEHRMYLPAIALSFGGIIFGFDLLNKRMPRYGIFIIFMLILIVFGSATYVRNMEFSDAIRLYRSELEKYPASQRIKLSLAFALNKKGQYPEGGKLLYELSDKYPDSLLVQKNLYLFQAVIEKKSRYAEISYGKIVLLLERDCYRPYADADVLWDLANYFFSKGNVKRTLYFLDYLVENYQYKRVWFLKAQCHILLGDRQKAVKAFKMAWEMDRADAMMQYRYGKSLLKAGENAKGCQILQMIADNPADPKVASLSRELLRNECSYNSIRP
jgi:tetratricopeptide (TPR) repeat protein